MKGVERVRMYEVSICQTKEWDWQMSIVFYFNEASEMNSFVALCLDQEMLVQIKVCPEEK